jgi:pantoate--beta-alanine ligase
MGRNIGELPANRYLSCVLVAKDAIELREALPAPPAFVPTMGALHEGHLSLIRHATTLNRRVAVSIYVNPTQFAPDEDLDTYPRSPEEDIRRAAEAGADVIFMPETGLIYPDGRDAAAEAAANLRLPPVATRPKLEDACRARFFGGVCLVVGRLFDLVRPASAIFGEKDYQQLRVIGSMVAEDPARFGGIDVVGRPTVRDPDGLAMSSRNAYLGEDQRERALGLSRALAAARTAGDPNAAEPAMRRVLVEHGLEIGYAVVRDAESLEEPTDPERPLRALIAAELDGLRLIDNAPMAP